MPRRRPGSGSCAGNRARGRRTLLSRPVADERLIGVHRVDIGVDRVVVATHAGIDVCRHVHQVSGRRHQRCKSLGTGHGERRLHLLDGMDVVMARAGVHRVGADGLFEDRHQLFQPRIGLALGIPVVPGTEVHQRLGVQYLCVEVAGELLRHLGHGTGVGAVERRTIRERGVGVARGEGLDVCPFAVGDLRGAGACLRAPPRWGSAGIHRKVDVGTEDQRGTPPAHGTRRVERCRRAERPLRLWMVEAVRKAQPLVEQPLRLGCGRDGHVMTAEAFDDGLGWLRNVRRLAAAAQRHPEQQHRSRPGARAAEPPLGIPDQRLFRHDGAQIAVGHGALPGRPLVAAGAEEGIEHGIVHQPPMAGDATRSNQAAEHQG